MKAKHPSCDIFCYDEQKINRLKPAIDNPNIGKAAAIFKVLADDTRAKITYCLCLEQELCVCDIANIVGATMATTSHHLRLLHKLGLAKYRKEGKLVFYSLKDDHVQQLFLVALTHAEEDGEHEEG